MQRRRVRDVASNTSLCLAGSVWSEFSSPESVRFRQHQPFVAGSIEHLFQVQDPTVSFELLGFPIRVSPFFPRSLHEARLPVAFDPHLPLLSIHGVLRSSTGRPLRPTRLCSCLSLAPRSSSDLNGPSTVHSLSFSVSSYKRTVLSHGPSIPRRSSDRRPLVSLVSTGSHSFPFSSGLFRRLNPEGPPIVL